MVRAGTSVVTTEPAATVGKVPRVTPQTITRKIAGVVVSQSEK